ncbi:unnamed protein product [Acanthoscelides obtectus]|uniref:SAM domain-containing protein n=1 Tax=Acanthoscelides obtectus TaxID=200917 RepID=A0A9P0K9W7_ACAOB|nr:unnamed protein product [Acanthoscelides obtectus]CAK1628100.1 Epidermal growth factor receptor kinase substrate 8-like protein 2 [Acanthoscelides obtectus]
MCNVCNPATKCNGEIFESPIERFNSGHGSTTPDHPTSTKNNADWIKNQRIEKPDLKPPPPPPMPTPSAPPTPQPIKRTQSQISTKSNNDKMKEELSSVLHYMRKRDGPRNIIIKQTEESYISQKSTPKEVQEWLEKKAFEKSIRDKFKGVAGYQMFDIKKRELETICGKEEGGRLHSQLLVMKSVTEYQTLRTTELRTVLAKVRQKIGDEEQ